MGMKIKIRNVEVDLLTLKEYQATLVDCISNDRLDVITMISSKTLDTVEKQPEAIEFLEMSDLILPGETAILTPQNEEISSSENFVVGYQMVMDELRWFQYNEKTMCMVVRSEKEARQLHRIFKNKYPYLKIQNIFVMDDFINDEIVINHMNSYAPDFLFVSMDSPKQEKWIADIKQMCNAKVCFAMGAITETFIRENYDVPFLIHKLGLGGIYSFFKNNL